MKNGLKTTKKKLRNKLWWYDAPFRCVLCVVCFIQPQFSGSIVANFFHRLSLMVSIFVLAIVWPSLNCMCHERTQQIQYGDLPTKYVSNLCVHVVTTVIFFDFFFRCWRYNFSSRKCYGVSQKSIAAKASFSPTRNEKNIA